MSEKKVAALSYASLGLRVFPLHSMTLGGCTCQKGDCTAEAKHPRIKGWPEAATTDTQKIEEWWTRWPEANIGIATGSSSNIWVLDLDGPEATEALATLEAENGPLPPTATVQTSRGTHRYFRWAEGLSVRSAKPFVKADTRGEGGYVVGPPSNHKSGAIYQWISPPDQTAFAVAPDWIVDLAQNAKVTKSKAVEAGEAFDELVRNLDLETVSGVSEGNRHNKAISLVGSALGRNLSLARTTFMSLKWAATCKPPFDPEELIQIIEYISQKELDKLENGINQVVDWPILGEAAFHGLAGEIVRFIEPETESDPAALLLQLLAFFGVTVGRKPHVIVEATKHFPNLFLVLVGESSKGRKGTSVDWIRKLFLGTTLPFPLPREISGLSSGEGLISAVRDPSQVPPNSKSIRRAEPTTDVGVSDKRLLVIETEFSNILSVLKREGNSLSAIIRAAWDGGTLNNQVKNTPMRATGVQRPYGKRIVSYSESSEPLGGDSCPSRKFRERPIVVI